MAGWIQLLLDPLGDILVTPQHNQTALTKFHCAKQYAKHCKMGEKSEKK